MPNDDLTTDNASTNVTPQSAAPASALEAAEQTIEQLQSSIESLLGVLSAAINLLHETADAVDLAPRVSGSLDGLQAAVNVARGDLSAMVTDEQLKEMDGQTLADQLVAANLEGNYAQLLPNQMAFLLGSEVLSLREALRLQRDGVNVDTVLRYPKIRIAGNSKLHEVKMLIDVFDDATDVSKIVELVLGDKQIDQIEHALSCLSWRSSKT